MSRLPENKSEKEGTWKAGERGGLRILLLEDSESDAELIVQEISTAGMVFVSRRTESREEFQREIHEFVPDIILADYSLPEFSALAALSLLKEERLDTPVILVTGSQSEEVAVHCMKQGADDYILKQSLTRLPSAIQNILERRDAHRQKARAEEALRLSEEKFRLLFASNPLPMFVYDFETLRFLEVNDAALSHYGYSREEFSRLWVTDLWSLDELKRLQETRNRSQARLNLAGNWIHQHKGGEWRNVHIITRILEMQQMRTELLITQDITEQTRAEEKLRQSREDLRALTAHLQSVREEERTRVAREIHDELGQVLTAIQMDLAWHYDKLKHVPQPIRRTLQSHTTSTTKLIETSIGTIRRIATELRPEILDDLGLIPAIEWQTQEFRSRTGIRCDFHSNVEEIHLDRQRSTAVFRILQESLTNVARHADATGVSIDLHVDEAELVMEVVDNGKGFQEEQSSVVRSLGLLGMRERAVLLGGRVAIVGTPGRGTSVSLHLPHEPASSSEKAKSESQTNGGTGSMPTSS